MTYQQGGFGPEFRVIEGGGQHGPDDGVPLPPAPQFCNDEMAAEMAQLFALALMQDLPLSDLRDPHAVLPVGPDITLHDLLCELRGLRWFDAEYRLSPSPWAELFPAPSGDPDRRRSRNWNRDGQLTLPILTRGPVALHGADRLAGARHLTEGDCEMPEWSAPKSGASIAAWRDWCCAARGVTDRNTDRNVPQTLRALTERVAQMPASRPFLALALQAIDDRHPADPGLAEAWKSTEILNLLALAEQEAMRLCTQRSIRNDRAARPAVMAARLAVRLSKEDRAPGDSVRKTALDLAYAAPRLLDWVHLANEKNRNDRALARNLFLPVHSADALPVHPADLAAHAMVAGAMATILKAVFETMPLSDSSRTGPRLRAADLDQVCSDIALARCVAATHFPAENHQDLRIGEALALRLLRRQLETTNAPGRLGLTDFDGNRLELTCRAGQFGQGFVTLLSGGAPVDWPLSGAARSHLTAVS